MSLLLSRNALLLAATLALAVSSPGPARADEPEHRQWRECEEGARGMHRDEERRHATREEREDEDRGHEKKDEKERDERHGKKRDRHDERHREREHGHRRTPCEADRRLPSATPRPSPEPAPDLGIDLGRCDRERLGQIIGGAIGGTIGSQIGRGDGRVGATIVGSIIGVLIGGRVGRWMDEVDQGCVGQVLERAPDQRVVAWSNPDGGGRYEVTPTYSFRDAQGRRCRDYRTVMRRDGQLEESFGTACRNDDGRWESVY